VTACCPLTTRVVFTSSLSVQEKRRIALCGSVPTPFLRSQRQAKAVRDGRFLSQRLAKVARDGQFLSQHLAKVLVKEEVEREAASVSCSGHFLNRRLAKGPVKEEVERVGTPRETKEEHEEAKEVEVDTLREAKEKEAAKDMEATKAPAKEVDEVDMLDEAKEKVAKKVVR
jgi:hypothetical protein